MTNGRLFSSISIPFGGVMRAGKVVYGSWQLAPVHDELGAEFEDVRSGLCGVLLVLLAPLLHHIQEKHPALAGINPVRPDI